MAPPPGRRSTHPKGKANQEAEGGEQQQDNVNQIAITAAATRVHCSEEINDLLAGFQDQPVFYQLSLIQLKNRSKELEDIWDQYERAHIDLMSETADAQEIATHRADNRAVKAVCREARDLLAERMAVLQPAPQAIAGDQPAAPVRVEVQHLESTSGNITNTWGTFEGDYTQWRAFRDRFNAAVHAIDALKPVQKLRLLLNSLKGEAKGVVGEPKLEDANYQKARDSLYDVYEDDFLIVTELLKKMFAMKRMVNPTNVDMRKIIDTVRDCLNGLSDFVPVNNWDPIIVFMVMERLDKATYEAWQAERSRLRRMQQQNNGGNAANADNEAENNNADEGAVNRAQVLPTWAELQDFLADRARNLVHSATRDANVLSGKSRGDSDTSHSRDSSGSSKRRDRSFSRPRPKAQASTGAAGGVARLPTGYKPCRCCNSDHPLYYCVDFLQLSIGGRVDRINEWGLCEVCLKDHSELKPQQLEECEKTISCKRCQNNKRHNSVLCPTREANRRAMILETANSRQLSRPRNDEVASASATTSTLTARQRAKKLMKKSRNN